VLHEIARYELDLAAVDIAGLAHDQRLNRA
jgi:hypothetical protein